MKKSVGERIVRVRFKMMTTTILRENKEKRMVCFSCADDEMECATNAVMRNNDDDDDDDDGERRASSSLCSSSFSSLSSSGEEKEDTMNFEKGISKKMMTTFMDRIEMNKTLILSSFMLPLGVTLAPNIDLEGHVCLNILRADWKPVLDINAVIYGLIYLFYEPNANDPLNKQAAKQLREKPNEFKNSVRQSLMGKSIRIGGSYESFPRMLR